MPRAGIVNTRMSPEQPRLVPLEEAARLARRNQEELRQWCATGRLRCDRVDGRWYVLESELHVAATMPIRMVDRSPSGRAVLAIAFSDREMGRRACELMRTRFGLSDEDCSSARLALDGRDLLIVAGTFAADTVDAVVEIARDHGGLIVDDVDAGRVERPVAEGAGRGQASYG